MQLCYFCLEEERGKGCRYNTTNLMAHGSSWLLYRWWVLYGATRLIFRSRVQGKCRQTLNETQTEVLELSIRYTL